MASETGGLFPVVHFERQLVQRGRQQDQLFGWRSRPGMYVNVMKDRKQVTVEMAHRENEYPGP